jgi:hypothetical protein
MQTLERRFNMRALYSFIALGLLFANVTAGEEEVQPWQGQLHESESLEGTGSPAIHPLLTLSAVPCDWNVTVNGRDWNPLDGVNQPLDVVGTDAVCTLEARPTQAADGEQPQTVWRTSFAVQPGHHYHWLTCTTSGEPADCVKPCEPKVGCEKCQKPECECPHEELDADKSRETEHSSCPLCRRGDRPDSDAECEHCPHCGYCRHCQRAGEQAPDQDAISQLQRQLADARVDVDARSQAVEASIAGVGSAKTAFETAEALLKTMTGESTPADVISGWNMSIDADELELDRWEHFVEQAVKSRPTVKSQAGLEDGYNPLVAHGRSARDALILRLSQTRAQIAKLGSYEGAKNARWQELSAAQSRLAEAMEHFRQAAMNQGRLEAKLDMHYGQ